MGVLNHSSALIKRGDFKDIPLGTPILHENQIVVLVEEKVYVAVAPDASIFNDFLL